MAATPAYHKRLMLDHVGAQIPLDGYARPCWPAQYGRVRTPDLGGMIGWPSSIDTGQYRSRDGYANEPKIRDQNAKGFRFIGRALEMRASTASSGFPG